MRANKILNLEELMGLEHSGLAYHFSHAVSRAGFASKYLKHLTELLERIDAKKVEQIILILEEATERGNTIYLLGNGGSAARASHLANDLNIGTRANGKRPIRAVSLTDNLPMITALANDEGYAFVFVRQLEGLLSPGDVVFGFSVSGNSENIIKAFRFASKKGALTVACTGFDGGELRRTADLCLHISTPKGEYGPVEDIFTIVGHLIYSYLRLSRRATNGAGRALCKQAGSEGLKLEPAGLEP